MIDVLALGEVLIDFTPAGENTQGIALFARNPGGAPANVLAMNAKLGGKTAFIGKVGNDAFGSFLKQQLESSNINVSGLVTDEKIPTTLAFVNLDSNGDRSFTFYRNPGADVMLNSNEVRKDLIDGCAIFHFGSLSLTDDPCRTATYEAVAYAKQAGKLISFDPNYRPLLWDNTEQARQQMEKGVAMADLLKVSEEEMTLLTGEEDVLKGSEILLSKGPSLVLVSMGEKGSFYRNDFCFGQMPTYQVKTIDTNGAGDAFLGAAHYCLKGKTAIELKTMPQAALEAILNFANAAGSLTTTKGGAIPAMPTIQEIEHCIATFPLLHSVN